MKILRASLLAGETLLASGDRKVFARCALLPALMTAFLTATAVAQPKPKSAPPKITPKSTAPRPSKEGVDFFEKKVRPILVKNCYKCHSGDPAKAKAHFVLDTHAGLVKGGDSGEVISPGHPEKSLLIEAVKYEGLEMPPDEQLPDEV